jgi:predicted rRNA methylase YqxC with S4 and FtsJ domains
LGVAQEIIRDMKEFLAALNCEVSGVIPSPVKGVKGNQEYLVHAVYRGEG